MANQLIQFLRGGSVYSDEAAAWAALDGYTGHLEGQPIVAFYNKTYAGKGDTALGMCFAIGTKNGGYEAVASHDDFLAVYKSLSDHLALFSEMFELVTEDDRTYIKAKYDFASVGEVSAYGSGSGSDDGSATLGALYGLVDVEQGDGAYVKGAEEGALLCYNGDKWEAIPQSAIKPDLTEYAKTTDVNSSINTAKAELDAKINAVSNNVTNLSSDVTDLTTRVDTAEKNIEDLQSAVEDISVPEYTLATVTPSSENVKEEYALTKDGTAVGSTIKVYKDSSLQEVYLGSSTDTINASTGVITKNTATDAQSLNFAYQLKDGTYSLTKIDVSKFLTQSEFGNGLAVSDAGVVSVKVDTTSQSNLSVGANGLKLSGVATSDELSTANEAIDALKARKVSVGNGLTGGGDLTADRTIALGTPSTITDESTNSATGTTHTHAIDEASTSKRGIVKLTSTVSATATDETTALTPKAGAALQTNINTVQTSVNTLGSKKITAGDGLSGDITLNAGGTMKVNVDNTSIVITSDALAVSKIDGGTF